MMPVTFHLKENLYIEHHPALCAHTIPRCSIFALAIQHLKAHFDYLIYLVQFHNVEIYSVGPFTDKMHHFSAEVMRNCSDFGHHHKPRGMDLVL